MFSTSGWSISLSENLNHFTYFRRWKCRWRVCLNKTRNFSKKIKMSHRVDKQASTWKNVLREGRQHALLLKNRRQIRSMIMYAAQPQVWFLSGGIIYVQRENSWWPQSCYSLKGWEKRLLIMWILVSVHEQP